MSDSPQTALLSSAPWGVPFLQFAGPLKPDAKIDTVANVTDLLTLATPSQPWLWWFLQVLTVASVVQELQTKQPFQDSEILNPADEPMERIAAPLVEPEAAPAIQEIAWRQEVLDETARMLAWLQTAPRSYAEQAFIQDARADKALYDATSFPDGSRFVETDTGSTIQYIARNGLWLYLSGAFQTALIASMPLTLGPNDAGFLWYSADYNHTWRWTGAAWVYGPGDRVSGEFAHFAADPGAGWALCDGAAHLRTNPDASTAYITLPNEVAGIYRKSGTPYTGSIVAATAPGFSGASVGAEAAHLHALAAGATGFPVTQGNGLLFAEEFDNAAWGKWVGNTVTPDATAAPDGTNTADELATSGDLGVQQSIVISGSTAGTYYTFSVWLKKITNPGNVDLYIEETGGASPTAYSLVSAYPLVGWEKFSITRKIVENDRTGITVMIYRAGYLSALYAWEGRLEQGSVDRVATGAGSSHTHSLSGGLVGSNGEPAHLVVLPYFRR